jgi:diguanylate cyclase (GGDEF)-like protein
MLLDLDRFEEINDTLGHHYGDEVLRQVGERLSSLLAEEDTVARLGGDEFAILLRSVETPAAGVAVAAAVRRAIAEHFDVAGVRLELGASVGIASFPEHGQDVDVLMQRADVAMYQAEDGRTGVERYVPELDGNSVQRLALAGDLRSALEREEFILHYQPKVDLRSNAVSGVEVLLRWAHPCTAGSRPTSSSRSPSTPASSRSPTTSSITRCARWGPGAGRGSTSASRSTCRRGR